MRFRNGPDRGRSLKNLPTLNYIVSIEFRETDGLT